VTSSASFSMGERHPCTAAKNVPEENGHGPELLLTKPAVKVRGLAWSKAELTVMMLLLSSGKA